MEGKEPESSYKNKRTTFFMGTRSHLKTLYMSRNGLPLDYGTGKCGAGVGVGGSTIARM